MIRSPQVLGVQKIDHALFASGGHQRSTSKGKTTGLLEPRSRSRRINVRLIGRSERIHQHAPRVNERTELPQRPLEGSKAPSAVCVTQPNGRAHDSPTPPRSRAFSGAGKEVIYRVRRIVDIDESDLRYRVRAASRRAGHNPAAHQVQAEVPRERRDKLSGGETIRAVSEVDSPEFSVVGQKIKDSLPPVDHRGSVHVFRTSFHWGPSAAAPDWEIPFSRRWSPYPRRWHRSCCRGFPRRPDSSRLPAWTHCLPLPPPSTWNNGSPDWARSGSATSKSNGDGEPWLW